jgi:hypothetical protein
MGVHSKLWEHTEAVFGSSHINKLEGKLQPVSKYPHKPTLTVIDGAGKIYRLGGSTAPIPFCDFIAPLTNGIRELLEADPTNCVFMLMDRESPKAKRANNARYGNQVPIETPASAEHNKIEVWRKFALEYWVPKSDVDNLIHSNVVFNSRFSWLVPPALATNENQPTLRNYFENPQFKAFFQEECCAYWAETLSVKPSQWLAIMGPNDFYRLHRGSETLIQANMFQFTYKEADPIIGHIIRVFDGYNINAISDDGDVVLVALLAQHYLIEDSERQPLQHTKFSRQCNVITKWNSNTKTIVYYDIETLWKSINYVFLDAWRLNKREFVGCPIMIFTIIAALNGNDYVRNLPQLSPKVYFDAALENAHLFTQLTAPWDSGIHEPIKLNCSSIVELILLTYKKKFKTLEVSAQVESTLAKIKLLSGKRAAVVTLADLRTRLGNLAFYLTYFLNAQYAQPPPSEFQQDAAGNSQYGYTLTNKDGKINVIYTDVPSLKHLEM